MIIENRVCRLRPSSGASWLERLSEPFAAALGPDRYPLRFSIVDVQQAEVVLEATVVHFHAHQPYARSLPAIEVLDPRRRVAASAPFVAVQIIPTGVRCEFGGFAGDAGPVTNLLASAADYLVTHPNAVNASDLNEMAANVLYVEGKSLDDFLLGHLGLAPVANNRIGTFVDPTGLAHLDDVVNALNAAQAVAGIRCELYTVLPEELGVSIAWSEFGLRGGNRDAPGGDPAGGGVAPGRGR